MNVITQADALRRVEECLAVVHRSIRWALAAGFTGSLIGFVIASRNDGIAMMQHTIFPFICALHLIHEQPSDRITIGIWAICGAGMMIAIPVYFYWEWRYDWPAIRRLQGAAPRGPRSLTGN